MVLVRPLKLIIAGGRALRISDDDITAAIFEAGWPALPAEVVSGCCPTGADRAGEAWAHRRRIPVARFPADWDNHGYAAGPRRNTAMAQYADALLAFWDGKSRGTRDMISKASCHGLAVHVVRKDPP